MKTYKVTPEWREWVYLITKEEVKRLVEDKCKKTIHCLIPTWPMMIWADWEIKSFNNFIDEWHYGMIVEKIAVTIPAQIWHHIAIPMDKLYLFDCGNIKEEELEVLTNNN